MATGGVCPTLPPALDALEFGVKGGGSDVVVVVVVVVVSLSKSSVLPSFSKSALAFVNLALRASAVDLFLLLTPFSLSSDDEDPLPSREILLVAVV